MRRWLMVGAMFGALACGSSDPGDTTKNTGGSSGSAGTSAAVCIPGAQVICDCADGSKAVQVCKPDGTGLGACSCAGGGGMGGAGGSAGAAGGASGGGGVETAGAGGQVGAGQAGTGGQAAGASGQTGACPATQALGMLNELQCAALTGPTQSNPSYDGVCGPACGRPSLVFGCTPGYSPGPDCVRVPDPTNSGAWVHCCAKAHCQDIGPGGNCPASTPDTYVCLYGNKPASKSCTHQDGSGQTEYLCCP